MKVKFYLARPAAKSQTAILASVSYNGHRIRVFTGENIDPKHWNTKTHNVRISPRFPEGPEFNRRLEKICSALNTVYLKYKNDHEAAPAPEILKKLCDERMGRGKEVQVTFLQFFKDFISRQASGLRVNPKTGKPIKSETSKHHQHTLNSITAYATAAGVKTDWQNIDLKFYNGYTEYLKQNNISLNTIGGHIRKLKTVLNEAAAHKHPVNEDYKASYFTTVKEDAENIALSESELTELAELDLSKNKRLEAVRDLFLIGCYTGLRFSDFSRLTEKHISEGFITISQQKTMGTVVIPVHPVVSGIIERYSGKLPPGISNQKTNSYIKEVCRMVPALQVKESKTTTKGGRKVTVTMERWQMISTHTGRRSFATIQYHKGIPSLTIMAITGHKTEKQFLRYIKVSPAEHAHKMRDMWAADVRQKMKAV